MSAIAIGRKLTDLGLRIAAKEPTEKAKAEDYYRFAPMKDGTPSYLWNQAKVAALLREAGMPQLSNQEADTYETAKMLINAAKQGDETGQAKLFYFAFDGIPERDYPQINRYVAQLGSALRLGDEPTKEQ